MYGYTEEEALGKTIFELIIDDHYVDAGEDIILRVQMGERWTGEFPVANKMGKRFSVACTLTPFYDDDGTPIGAICVSIDAKPFKEIKVPILDAEDLHIDQVSIRPRNNVTTRFGQDPEQSSQTSIASRITNLASRASDKVRSKLKIVERGEIEEDGSRDSCHPNQDGSSSGASSPLGEPPFGFFSPHTTDDSAAESQRDSSDESERKIGFRKILTSKAEAWIGKKAMKWSRKGNEQESSEARSGRSGWPWMQCEVDSYHPCPAVKPELYAGDSNCPAEDEDLVCWPPFNVNSSNSASSYKSGSSSSTPKLDTETDSLEYEIKYEDLTFGEQIGQGHSDLHAVLIKLFVYLKRLNKLKLAKTTANVIHHSYDCRMLQLRSSRSKNTRKRLYILSDRRGSLFKLLQKSASKLDRRRRINMALDIARGMNYLHSCNPPIIHCDLKSSNLLVDKNWLLKVADFGLSRVKYETYLTTKTWKGTPQWMAPEVIRNERSDEKSDIYSFAVILWELATQKIPWEQLNSMQVIGAVGFMNQRLEVPDDVDPRWASIIESCWDSEPQKRPSFRELLEILKALQKQYAVQAQAACAAAGNA